MGHCLANHQELFQKYLPSSSEGYIYVWHWSLQAVDYENDENPSKAESGPHRPQSAHEYLSLHFLEITLLYKRSYYQCFTQCCQSRNESRLGSCLYYTLNFWQWWQNCCHEGCRSISQWYQTSQHWQSYTFASNCYQRTQNCQWKLLSSHYLKTMVNLWILQSNGNMVGDFGQN